MQPGWYFLSYDIKGSRLGQRVHRLIRKQAQMLLESLYLHQGNAESAAKLLQQLRHEAKASAQNIVMYRLRQDSPIYVAGQIADDQGIVNLGLPLMQKLQGFHPIPTALQKP
ncbi:MAG: CRISPR-associated endonuclease Cas2 [Pseudomonadota bacterium]|nr:CRISPR-associated endonuclease Cas2 [Pseudomonadota bacterium]